MVRHPLVRAALAVALAAVLGGCLAAPSPKPADDGSLLAQPLSWSGCTGVRVGLTGASPRYPSSAPAGWEPDTLHPLATVRVLVLRCQRVAWDGFERGPVFLLQEWRDDFRAPEACWAGDHDARYLLESIWFSDGELARHAAGLGLPAHAARFDFRNTFTGSLPVEEWSWDVGDGATARITLPVAGESDNRTEVDQSLVFWADGDGVASFAVRSNVTAAELGWRPAWGSLPAPMLHGRAGPNPAFASASAIRLRGVDGVADLHRFRDRSCAQPL